VSGASESFAEEGGKKGRAGSTREPGKHQHSEKNGRRYHAEKMKIDLIWGEQFFIGEGKKTESEL